MYSSYKLSYAYLTNYQLDILNKFILFLNGLLSQHNLLCLFCKDRKAAVETKIMLRETPRKQLVSRHLVYLTNTAIKSIRL